MVNIPARPWLWYADIRRAMDTIATYFIVRTDIFKISPNDWHVQKDFNISQFHTYYMNNWNIETMLGAYANYAVSMESDTCSTSCLPTLNSVIYGIFHIGNTETKMLTDNNVRAMFSIHGYLLRPIQETSVQCRRKKWRRQAFTHIIAGHFKEGMSEKYNIKNTNNHWKYLFIHWWTF